MLTKARALLMAATLLISPATFALESDASQPIHISADSASRNEQTGITRYNGNVELTQGTLKIAGQTVEIRQNNDGSVATIIARGDLAHFQQQAKPNEPLTHAYGKVLDYNIATEALVITGNAKVTQGDDRFSGNRIVYDIQKSTVNAYSDSNKADNGQRVQMVIQPKPQTSSTNTEQNDQ